MTVSFSINIFERVNAKKRMWFWNGPFFFFLKIIIYKFMIFFIPFLKQSFSFYSELSFINIWHDFSLSIKNNFTSEPRSANSLRAPVFTARLFFQVLMLPVHRTPNSSFPGKTRKIVGNIKSKISCELGFFSWRSCYERTFFLNTTD